METPESQLQAPRPEPAAGWTIHCDGSAVPNPGRMAYGAVLVAPDGRRRTLSVAATGIGCNNEAELRALMAALAMLPATARAVVVHSDNSILVAQLGGGALAAPPPPIARLAPLFDEARQLIATFDAVRLLWIPRHRNHEADTLARAAQGLGPKLQAPPKRRRRR